VVRHFNNDILEIIQVEGKALVVRLFSNDILDQYRKKEKPLVVSSSVMTSWNQNR
jgi:hypothetical protein